LSQHEIVPTDAVVEDRINTHAA